MIKKLNLLRTLLMLSFLTIFALSCKKDGSNDENLTEAQRIANAKDWHQKTGAKIALKSSKKSENVSQEISWANAKLYKQDDGSEIIGVPINIKLNSGAKASGSYLLMLSKTGETYKHLIAYNAEKNHFTKAINEDELKNLYTNTIKANVNQKSTSGTNASKGKVMVVPEECTAWFLTETYYNEYGEIIEYYEHYLYTICTGNEAGGGEGGGTNPEEFIPDFGNSVSIDEGGGTDIDIIIDSVPGKMREKSWKFHDGITYWGKSTEKLIVRVVNGERTWHSITHLEHSKVGGWVIGEVTYFSVTMTPNVIVGSSGNSSMEAKYKVNLKPLSHFGSYNSDYMYSYATWNTMFIKQ